MNAVLAPSRYSHGRERLADVIDEVKPLLMAHWAEIATWKDIPLEPMWIQYFAAEQEGKLRIYTCRRDGQLIGYAVFGVASHLHYAGCRVATADIVYIAPDERRGRIGIHFLDYVHEKLRADGVDVISHHVKTAHPALGHLLKHQGFTPIEQIWMKRL